jgi:DNA repair protein SbcD/Mre11
MIRLLHTSDWHLGRAFHGYSLEEDQRYALNQILTELEHDYHALMISGDIYDRAVPSVEAVNLFSDFLINVRARNIACVIIPGNHDSAERMGFAATILDTSGIHFRCDYTRLAESITLKGAEGEELDIFALPFIETALVRQAFRDDTITTHELATQKTVACMRGAKRAGVPAVLIAHAFVGKGSLTSESERVFLGGADRVPADIFFGFDYVALGHLHRPQKVECESIRYSGSLLPYSFSEAGIAKEMVRIDITKGLEPQLTAIPITPLHQISIIEDSFNEALDNSEYHARTKDFVSIRLTDDAYHVDTYHRLKQRFPLLCELRQLALENKPNAPSSTNQPNPEDSPSNIIDLFLDHFGWSDPNDKASAKEILTKSYRDAESRKREAPV